MLDLEKSWDSYGADAPNQLAVTNANRIIESLGIEPATLRPSAEAGVMLRFEGAGNSSAFVECYNDGEIGYTLIVGGKSVGSRDMRDEGLDPLEFVAAIRKHLDPTSPRRIAI